MPESDDEYYLDTNAIIEINRTDSWKAMRSNYDLHTVEKVVDECGSGNSHSRDYVIVDTDELKRDATIHTVSHRQLVDLELVLNGRVSLDAGEKHLLAYCIGRSDPWHVTSPDKALMRACFELNKMDRVISLEELFKTIGHKPSIKLQREYSKKWLSEFRTGLLLG